MWFRFPQGTDQISVEQQRFMAEAEDKDGNKFFRAPDVLAPTILALPGYTRANPPEGAPEDLPATDPKRAEAVDKLSADLAARDEEIQRLRQNLGAARREKDELQTKYDDLEIKYTKLETESAGLENDKEKEIVKPKPGATSTAQPPISKENANVSSSSDGPSQNKPSGR